MNQLGVAGGAQSRSVRDEKACSILKFVETISNQLARKNWANPVPDHIGL